jgi:hypothetical protein
MEKVVAPSDNVEVLRTAGGPRAVSRSIPLDESRL